MRKYKTVAPEGASHRIVEGQLRVCSSDDKKNYKVKLMLLNEKVNRNNWQYLRVADHAREAENIPLLYSVINGKVGNSHDFEIVTDERGNQYASFIGAESEHPYGWLPETVNGRPNAHMETIDGTDWLVSTAYLPSFYNKEMIDELERNNGQMPISIETLVTKYHMDGDVEVEEEYSIVGVTILGVTTTPAVAGANIRKLALTDKTMKEMRLKVASLVNADSIEPQTQKEQKNKQGVGRAKMFLNINDVRDKFEGKTVLKINGLTVALLDDDGNTYTYTFQENETTVVPERIVACAVNSVFGEGESAVTVSATELVGAIQAKLNAAKAALQDETKKVADLTAKLNKMEEAELNRRKDSVKKAVKDRLATNRNSGFDLPETLCDHLITDDCVAKYAGMTDSEGCFCGDEQAARDVDALCMNEIREERAKQAKNNEFHWDMGLARENDSAASRGVMESLKSIQD